MEEQATIPEQDTIPEGSENVEGNEQAPETKPSLMVKYNSEEQEISYEDAVPLIQKGMNYDKLSQKLEGYTAKDKQIQFVEKQAKKYGITPEEYLLKVEESEKEEEKTRLIEQGIPEKYAEQMLSNKESIAKLEKAAKEAASEKSKNDMYKDFFAKFPDIQAKDIPPEVLQSDNLIVAYTEHENKLLKDKLAELETQEKGEKATPGSLTGGEGTKEKTYDRDTISKMTPKERVENLPKIMSQKKHWLKPK